jgi:hypothetical protein
MIRCWKILAPLKLMTGFEDAVTALEQVMMKLEAIDFASLVMGPIVVPDSSGRQLQQFQFQPPRCRRSGAAFASIV